jgi:lysophospholipase L1-like esterase
MDLAGDEGPARRRHRIRIPARTFAGGSSAELALVSPAGAPVPLERVRLVEARPRFALHHLARRGRLPTESSVFLAASLAALLFWQPEAAERAGQAVARPGGAAVALALLALGAVLPAGVPVADVPRWLWLAAPWPLLLLGPLAPRWRPRAASIRTGLTNGLLAVTALAVAVVGAEMALRFVHRRVQSAADDRAYFARRQAEQNSLGFREREFAPTPPLDTYRIAVVGDSLAWGIGVSPGERFSGQVEQALNERRGSGPTYEVLNLSHAGWDTAQELDALRTVVLGTRPDFVILQWYVNDFENGVRTERPRPAPLVPWEPLRLWLFHASAFYSILEEKWVRVQEGLGPLPTYPEYMYRRFGDPRSPHSADTVATLRAFIAECRQRGVPVAVLLFPHVGPDLTGGRYEYDYLHDRVLEACRAEGIGCVDLRPTFAGYADYRQLWVSPLDPHPSALAHRLAAERLLETFGPAWLGDDAGVPSARDLPARRRPGASRSGRRPSRRRRGGAPPGRATGSRRPGRLQQ